MSRFKGIASFLIALSLFSLVSESAEARCRKRCRPHRSHHHHCCAQTCHYETAPAPCGCGMTAYESSSTYDEQQVQKIDSSQMNDQSYGNEAANDQVPAPPTAANSAPPAPPRAESAPANYQGDNPNEGGDQRSAADVEQTPGQNSDQSLAPDSSDVPLRPGSTN